MLISLVVPYFKREDDLAVTLPYTQAAANTSPPCEIILFDYELHCDHWQPAPAYNMAIRASHGAYFVLMGADAILSADYVGRARDFISQGTIWMRGRHCKGIICCQREAFEASGGYDERFTLYGPEDQELEERLVRRGYSPAILPSLVRVIPTPDSKKIANYGILLSKKQMATRMHRILDENRRNGLMIANER